MGPVTRDDAYQASATVLVRCPVRCLAIQRHRLHNSGKQRRPAVGERTTVISRGWSALEGRS